MIGKRADEAVDLSGQVAIVTGGGRGLGRAYALRLAQAGAAVAVVARSSDQLAETVRLIELEGGRALALTADVSDRAAVQGVVAEVEERLGPVDLLVNNAGVAGPTVPAWEAEPNDWWRCLEINLRGPYLCARTVLPGMIERRRGRIINAASTGGCFPLREASAYSTSKAALIRLTENLALEAAQYGVMAFAICPGTVRTAMTEGLLAHPRAKEANPYFVSLFEKGQDDPPELAAGLVLYLASGKADALTGRFFSVHDDCEDMVAHADEVLRSGKHTLRLKT